MWVEEENLKKTEDGRIMAYVSKGTHAIYTGTSTEGACSLAGCKTGLCGLCGCTCYPRVCCCASDYTRNCAWAGAERWSAGDKKGTQKVCVYVCVLCGLCCVVCGVVLCEVCCV